MLIDLNLEELYKRIQDARTREYFEEVLGDFYSGHYRSAVVMLYSVVMADLIFKLQQLEEIYEDEAAKNILNVISQMQTENPKSPAWEETICRELVQNHRIISTPELVHIEALRQDRHICAHPVVSTNGELHRPNRATVYSHMINALSEILCRPAFLERELLVQILKDLASLRSFMKKGDEIRNYLKNQYLNRLNNPDIEVNLFLKLWKFVFFLKDPDASKNRDVNLCMLSFLYNRNEPAILDRVKLNAKKYSVQIDISDITILDAFVKLCNVHPKIYETLTDAFKIPFKAKLKQTPQLEHIVFFLHDNLKPYFEQLLADLEEDDDWKYMMNYIETKMGREEAMRIPISIFAGSGSFDGARRNYNNLIEPYLDEFTLKNYQAILNAINQNYQIKNSYVVQGILPILKEHILKLDTDFDFSPYSFIE